MENEIDFIKAELASIKSLLLEISNGLTAPERISVDVKEAAHMIGVSKSTLYILIGNKEIAYSSIGGKKVIKLKEIERLLADREIRVRQKLK